MNAITAMTKTERDGSAPNAETNERAGHAKRSWLQLTGAVVLCAMLIGCAKTRSISNVNGPGAPESSRAWSAGNPGRPGPTGQADPGFEYQGELNEFDVLGLDRTRMATEDEIAQALERAVNIKLSAGSRIMLVQSGAVLPDGAMIAEMEKHFRVVPFSGVPLRQRTATDPEPTESSSYSKNLRLAAARAGAETIVCYWGALESARRRMETKTVSWVPIAGWLVPDESQQMRIRLKLALIDVRSGSWQVVAPEPFTDKAWSTHFTRGSSDLHQVESLKQKAYEAGAKALAQR
jgi:hypothetical protein